jgi:hypothetical protein
MNPSLPLIDGCWFVDNSTKDIFTTCPTAGDYYVRHRRVLASEGTALRYGGIIHEALAMRNRIQAARPPSPWSAEDEQAQLKHLVDQFSARPCETESWRNVDSAIKLLRAYNAQTRLDSYTFATDKANFAVIEMPFAAYIGDVRGVKIIYCGKIDRTVVLQDGIFVWDYKTSSMLGDTFWQDLAMSEQMRGYCWALRETLGIEPTGYIIDVLVTRESIVNAVFDDATGTIINVRNSLKESKAKPVEFARQRFFTKEPPGQLDEWRENFLAQCDMFLYFNEKGQFPRYHKHCVGKYGCCPYYRVCELPARSRQSALDSGAFEDVKWSPLNPH